MTGAVSKAPRQYADGTRVDVDRTKSEIQKLLEQQIAKQSGKKIVLASFDVRADLEEIKP